VRDGPFVAGKDPEAVGGLSYMTGSISSCELIGCLCSTCDCVAGFRLE
jgi:hypothetical protein